MVNVLLIVGGAVLIVIVAAVALFVFCSILAAWEYAKSPMAQMAEELEDNGSIEG